MACKAADQTTGRRKVHKPTKQARSAQSLVRYHVQVGHLTRPKRCEQCGKRHCAIEAAHYDYAEPLRVRWVCRSCHRKWDCRRPKHGTVAAAIEPQKTSAEQAEVEEVAK